MTPENIEWSVTVETHTHDGPCQTMRLDGISRRVTVIHEAHPRRNELTDRAYRRARIAAGAPVDAEVVE